MVVDLDELKSRLAAAEYEAEQMRRVLRFFEQRAAANSLTAADAAESVLRDSGVPMRHSGILRELKRRGFRKPHALAQALKRDPRFQRVAYGVWSLADAITRTTETEDDNA